MHFNVVLSPFLKASVPQRGDKNNVFLVFVFNGIWVMLGSAPLDFFVFNSMCGVCKLERADLFFSFISPDP